MPRISPRRDRQGPLAFLIGGGLVVLAVFAFIVWLVMFIAGWGSTPVDKVGLHYSGGPIDGNKFVGVLEPGSRAKFLGLLDNLHTIPVNQRNYVVDKDVGEGDREGADEIVVPAKNGVAMSFEVSVFFKVNTATDDIEGTPGGTARRFYEQICTKAGFSCDEDSDGWDRLLGGTLRKVLEASMRQKVFNYTVDELYANREGEASGTEDAILKIQTEIAATLKENVNRTLGGNFFCGPTFDRRAPDECPDMEFVINSAIPVDESVRASFEAQQASQNAIQTARNDAQAKRERADGDRQAAEAGAAAYRDPNYLAYIRAQASLECARNPNCTLVITQEGTNTNVNVGAGTG